MKPAFPYPGGKSKLLDSIVPFIPRDGVRTYVEPFAGGLAVLLAHDNPFPLEVANDLNPGLMAFYRVAARHPEALIAELSGMLASRADFENEVAFPARRTELGRAALWYYLAKQSFGAQLQHFGRGKAHFNGIDHGRDFEAIRALSSRLRATIFRNVDALDVIREFDSEGTFFFVDPPYVACAETAYAAFTEDDMARLRDVLSGCSGRWLLTCDDSPATRRVFHGFPARGNEIRYTLSKLKTGKVSRELMIFSPRLAAEFPGATSLLVDFFPSSSAGKKKSAV